MRMKALPLLVLFLLITSLVTCAPPRRIGFLPFARPTSSLPPTKQRTPTAKAVSPTKVPTGSPTAQPTGTRRPTIAPAEPSRIRLESGETSATLKGHLDAHETDEYVLYGREGEKMSVVVEAPKQVGLTIWGADGIPLKRRVDEEMSWQGELPATQDIFIAVSSIETTDYTLTVTLLPASPKASIEVIAPNGGETWLEGSDHTISWQSKGVENVDVEVASGGKPWIVALNVDAASGRAPWEIRVGLISDFGVASSDEMRVRVYSSDDPELYDESDEPFTVRCPRIQFAPGAVSATVTGTLQAGGGRYRYALRASAGQDLELEVVPAQVEGSVWGAEDGSTWEIPTGKTNLTIQSLPAKQDYFITLTNISPTDVVHYGLDVVIR